MFRYQLAGNQKASLKIYNTLGQLVKTLIDEVQGPGNYRVEWDGSDNRGRKAASGVYFYRLVAGSYCDMKKLVFLK